MGNGVRISSRGGKPTQPVSPEKKYKITIGSHLSSEQDLIGHAYISIEHPEGTRTTAGFYPAESFALGSLTDGVRLAIGVKGELLLKYDEKYLNSEEGLNAKRTFEITESQAQKALKVIHQYLNTKPSYNIVTNQCTVFALKAFRAATGKKIAAGWPPNPRDLYTSLGGTQKLQKVKLKEYVKP